jgi:hypothetical protein
MGNRRTFHSQKNPSIHPRYSQGDHIHIYSSPVYIISISRKSPTEDRRPEDHSEEYHYSLHSMITNDFMDLMDLSCANVASCHFGLPRTTIVFHCMTTSSLARLQFSVDLPEEFEGLSKSLLSICHQFNKASSIYFLLFPSAVPVSC